MSQQLPPRRNPTAPEHTSVDRAHYNRHDLLAALVHHVYQIVSHSRQAHDIAQQLDLAGEALPEERALLDLIRRCAQMKTPPALDPTPTERTI